MTPEERAEKALDIELHFTCIGANDWPPLVGSIAETIRAATDEAREEAVRNHRKRLREWLAEHGVQPVKGESMLETGWRAAVAEEREGCAQMADYVCKCALHDELMPEHVSECRMRNEIAASIRARGEA